MTQPPQTTGATGLTAQWIEAQNPATQERVTMAMVRYTQTVTAEPEDTPNHEARLSLASQVARMPQMWTQPFTLAVCAQGFNSQGDDGALSDWIGVVWNAVAGTSAAVPRAVAPPAAAPPPPPAPPPSA